MDAIAIVGMAGRFPGAANLAEFWRNLCAGVEGIAQFSEAQLLAAGLPVEWVRKPGYVRAKGYLDQAEHFDAPFFGYAPRDAELLDPQQRLLLECAWEALEDAGYAPGVSPRPVGVFVGVSMNTYLPSQLYANRELLAAVGGYQVMVSNDKDFAATRISYALNLTGPSLGIQTACSTSLVAVERACRSLIGHECDMALAGGASVSYPRIAGYQYQEGMILSPDGHCRVFDAAARGTVGGEGVGVVALKRLSEALADRDPIYAVIRGWATNNDGSEKVGFTAPGVAGQAAVIAAALALAGVDARSVSYVEAHGTGTELGDPVELSALTQVFAARPDRQAPCRIGSVKSNIGHLDAGAGVAGLIKTALALQSRRIPASLHFQQGNPQIDWNHCPFRVQTETGDWPAGSEPRRAGISSFGIGGTNAHLVLEEAPPLPPAAADDAPQLILLSARTAAALDAAAAQLAQYLRDHPAANLADVAYTLQVGRRAFPQRRALMAMNAEQAWRGLSEPGQPPGQPPGQINPGEMEPRHSGYAERAATLEAAARAWLGGADVDWQSFHGHGQSRRISLPTYPFERTRYCVEATPTVSIAPEPSNRNTIPAAPAAADRNHNSVTQRLPVTSWFSVPYWRQVVRDAPVRALQADCWLLFLDDCGLGAVLEARLRSAGQRVITVRPDSALDFSRPDACTMNPELYGDYIALFEHVQRNSRFPNRIVHLWNVSRGPDVGFDERQILGFYSLLFLSQVLGRQSTTNAVQIDVISNELQRVTGDEVLQPDKATLRGPLLVAPQEYPHIAIRSIDLVLPPDPEQSLDELAAQALRELAIEITETEVAWRGTFRWIRAYETLPMAAPDAAAPRIRPGGVYWLLGGLGKIGLQLAEVLARSGAGQIVLTGRRGLPPRAQWDAWRDQQDPGAWEVRCMRAILQMEALGTEVHVLPADVSDSSQLQGVLQKIDSEIGALSGVVHAAGHVEGRIMYYLGRDDCESQFQGKPRGLLALAPLLQHRRLDFCVVTSSLSSVVGGIGFCAYAAANAFLDAFASDCNRRGGAPWLSLNWDGWQETETLQTVHYEQDRSLLITESDGKEAFARLLAARWPDRAVISTIPLEPRIDQWVRRQAMPTETMQELLRPIAVHPRPETLATPYVAPRTELEQTIAEVWQQLLGIERIGIHDDYIQLGGHSLMGGQLISRLRKVLQAPLSIRSLFETMTVARLAAHVETQRWALQGQKPGGAGEDEDQEEFEV